ncbi:uncharacterized protein LOC131166219 [Malania oleifera]|uniref:uncharacterized protein LOC131166219 n=1 Tax=Malania oleifera TaxID=397392 RepID=UPI0025ADAE43|nr:uncharacterized protein LOC131166219 [Malania oleifera]
MDRNRAQRALFGRMMRMELNPERVRKTMAFWLWLESELGIENASTVRKLSSCDDYLLGLIFMEAEEAMAALQLSNSRTVPIRIPFTFQLLSLPDQRELLLADRVRASKAISGPFYEIHGINPKGINGFAGFIMEKWGDGMLLAPPTPANGEKLAPNAAAAGAVRPPMRSSSKLDPGAKEWDFWRGRAPEQDRCLFLTFSNGYPLDELDIIRFFNQKYGGCVERVYVHRPALFGKVVFTNSVLPLLVLNGHDNAKFIINGRTVWCKKFQLHKNHHNNNDNNNTKLFNNGDHHIKS